MCLSVPAKVIHIKGDEATVSIGGTEYKANLQMVDDVKVGDYILLHTGFAIQKLSEEDAKETMRLLQELADIDEQIRREEEE